MKGKKNNNNAHNKANVKVDCPIMYWLTHLMATINKSLHHIFTVIYW